MSEHASPPPLGVSDQDALDPETEAMVNRVYFAALQHPDPTRSLLIAQGMPAEVVDRSLHVLALRGLVRLHDGGTVELLPPDIALPALAADLERRAREARSAAHELGQIYFQARSPTQLADGAALRILRSMEELAAATSDIVSSATERVRAFRSMSPRTLELFSAPMASHEEPSVGAGGVPIAMTAVYDTEVLSLEGALRVLEARERGGEHFRFISGIPFSAVIADDNAAVVDMSAFDSTGSSSVLVRSRPMAQALAALSDRMWDMGFPLSRTSSAQAAERRDQTILALLAAGSSDATIARQTGISQRTVERRVRVLMDRLGATTRFQAGVMAVRRGLL